MCIRDSYYTLHRSDLAARAAPLDPRLLVNLLTTLIFFYLMNYRSVLGPTIGGALSEKLSFESACMVCIVLIVYEFK